MVNSKTLLPVAFAVIATVSLASACSGETDSVEQSGSLETVTPARQPDGVLAVLDIDALRALSDARSPAHPFWYEDATAQAARIERILRAERAARAAVVGTLGEAAVEHPAFASLFRPLQDRLPELSANAQVVIAELEREFVAARLRSPDTSRFADLLAPIRSRFGDEFAIEYALRSSPLAAELRSAGLGLDEHDFREAYANSAALESADDSAAFVTARLALRNLLGAHRFARFWSQRDTGFARMRATAERLGLTEDTLLAAYALLLENQDAMIAAAVAQRRRGNAPEDAQQATLRSLYDENRRRLGELTGAQAAEALLQAFAATAGGASAER